MDLIRGAFADSMFTSQNMTGKTQFQLFSRTVLSQLRMSFLDHELQRQFCNWQIWIIFKGFASFINISMTFVVTFRQCNFKYSRFRNWWIFSAFWKVTSFTESIPWSVSFSNAGDARSKSKSSDVRSSQYLSSNVLRFSSKGSVFIRFEGFSSSSDCPVELVKIKLRDSDSNLWQFSTMVWMLMGHLCRFLIDREVREEPNCFSRGRNPPLKVSSPEFSSMWSSLSVFNFSNSRSSLSLILEFNQILLTEERMRSNGVPLSSANNWVGKLQQKSFKEGKLSKTIPIPFLVTLVPKISKVSIETMLLHNPFIPASVTGQFRTSKILCQI